jgi:exonuclease VII large subunit
MTTAYEGQPSKRKPRMVESEAENEERIQREVDQRVAAHKREFEDMAAKLKAEMAEQTQQLVQQQLAQMMAQRTEPIVQESPRVVQSSCQSVQLQPYFDPIQVIQRNTYCSIRFN